MTGQDWLTHFGEAGSRVRSAIAGLVGTDAGRVELSVGAGGDRTVEVDRAAEAAALSVFEEVAGGGTRFSVLSEEIGLRAYGADFPLVLMDPIDGSVNAKLGIPMFAVMLSLLDGPTVGELAAGYVLNLANGDTWAAVRGQGAARNGAPLRPLPARGHDLLKEPVNNRFDVLGLESSPGSLFGARPLVERASKVRILGSMALSIAHTAAGAIDLFCAPMQARVFDMTASLLLVSETGGVATDMSGASLAALTADLGTRTTLLCAADARAHASALSILERAR